MQRGAISAITCLMAASLGTTTHAQAVPAFARVLTDHAVLQRGTEISLWGAAAPGALLKVSLGDAVAMAQSDAAGQWKATFAPHQSGGPYELTVQDAFGHASTLKDIMVGDIWLCSGQSNMAQLVRYATNAETIMQRPVNERLRFVNLPLAWSASPRSDLDQEVRWQVAAPDTVGDASAVCYATGHEIADRENVTIGMINASVGGTVIDPWIPTPALFGINAYYDTELDALRRYKADPAAAMAAWKSSIFDWWARNEPGPAAHDAWAAPDLDDRDWPSAPQRPNWKLYGHPELERFNGVIWYRTSFSLSAAQSRKAASLRLGQIKKQDTAFVNGKPVGATDTEWTFREYQVPIGVLRAGRNVIAVRVYSESEGGGLLGKPEMRTLTLDGEAPVSLPKEWHYGISATVGELPMPPVQPWREIWGFSGLFNAMIAPLENFRPRGVIWYQGEGNASLVAPYDILLPRLIQGWRQGFEQEDLPFLIVQLSAYPRSVTPWAGCWAEIREVQRRVAHTLPKVAVVPTVDLGDRFETHYGQKAAVGIRLAQAAEKLAYGRDVPPMPDVDSVTRSGADLVVHFVSGTQSLSTYSASFATGFEVCDRNDRCTYVPGQPVGATVILPRANLPSIVKVRYGWSDSPILNLFTGDDLPVIPFELIVP